MRAFESAVVGFALALVIAGAALAVLTAPWFTRALAVRLDVATSASLPPPTAARLAEEVRSFSTRREGGSLPSEIGGRPAFDSAAVSHLLDVRVVFVAAQKLTLVLAAVLAVWLGSGVARRRFDRMAAVLRAGGVWCLVLPVALGVVGTADFEWFFSAFHGVFFDSGTWTFPADSLLIQLFPEPFWMTSGAVFAALVVLGGGLLWFASLGLRRVARPGIGDTLRMGA